MTLNDDDCDCDILASNEFLKHAECKIIKLMDKQLKKAENYVKQETENKPYCLKWVKI